MRYFGISSPPAKQRLFAEKGASENRSTANTGATLTDDADLTLTLTVGVNYLVEAFLIVTSASLVPDFKFKWSYTAAEHDRQSFEVNESGVGIIVADSDSGLWSATFVVPLNTVNKDHIIYQRGILKPNATSFTLQWAQNTADATATQLRTQSWLHAREAVE